MAHTYLFQLFQHSFTCWKHIVSTVFGTTNSFFILPFKTVFTTKMLSSVNRRVTWTRTWWEGELLYKIVKKLWTTGSFLNQNKIHKLLFLLEEVWFILSKSVPAEITDTGVPTINLHLITLLYTTSKSESGGQSAHIKSQGPCCLEEQVQTPTVNSFLQNCSQK